MRVKEDSTARASDRFAIRADRPREADARSKTRPIRIVYRARRPERARTNSERTIVAGKQASVALLGNGPVVVADSRVDRQVRSNPEIVLDESADLIHMHLKKREGKINLNLVGNI